MTPSLFSADMKPLRLATRVGKGGEGEVYALDGISDQVVKFYTVVDTQSREAKINKMIGAGLAKLTPLIAFPIALVRNKAGGFAGFTMMKISGCQPLHELYSPGGRKAAFPRADYRFLVRTAANIARAVGSAHANNCVIGDINHSGILISDRAVVALIDADSFQIMDGTIRHACKVGTPEYTPPELQGQSLDGVLRTPNHDAFGLAIAIFQLLWMGRHPFSGKYSGGEMPLEKAIREFRFAYSGRPTGMQPPPAAPRLKDFPSAIGAAFEQAFGPQGVRERPSAKQWMVLLQELEQSLIKCSKIALHYHPPEASECPWCRMERMFGVPLFVPALPDFSHSAAFIPMAGDIASIWRVIEAVERPQNDNPIPKLNLVTAALPSKDAQAASAALLQRRVLGAALLAVAAVIAIAAPAYILFSLIAGGFGLNRLFSKPPASHDFERRYRGIEARWLEAERNWKNRAGTKEFDVLRDKLRSLKVEYEGLAAEERQRISAYQANRRSEQLRIYLEGFQIRRTKIAHVGPAKLQVLTSYGIETAADVSSVAVQNVPGFGPVNSVQLVEWRARLERGFVYNANPTQADTVAVNRIRAEIGARGAQIKAELGTGPQRLRGLAQAIRQMQETIDPALQQLSDQRERALADLQSAGIRPPVIALPAAAPVTIAQPLTGTATSGQTPRCPRCGSPMISRTARRGRNVGSRFYGCTRYPQCSGTRPFP